LNVSEERLKNSMDIQAIGMRVIIKNLTFGVTTIYYYYFEL